MPSVALRNAARPGTLYPAVGLGTGGYGYEDNVTHPECWMSERGAQCGARVERAVADWIRLGGRRLDTANSYYNLASVGAGIRSSGIDPAELFITTKIGPSYALGYQDAKNQMQGILRDLGVPRVDLTLIHWPDQREARVASTDPLCNAGPPSLADQSAAGDGGTGTALALPNTARICPAATRDPPPPYNATECRLSTWRAMVELWTENKTRAIGVSNFNSEMLQEFERAGMPLPALNQCPFNPYRGVSTYTRMLPLMRQRGILLAGYSPLGVPDLAVSGKSGGGAKLQHGFPPPMAPTLLQDPVVLRIAARLGRTAAQVVVNWQWAVHGVPLNPRTENATHMRENLDALEFTLSAEDVKAINDLPQDWCSEDSEWYECAGNQTAPCPLTGCW
eukprot:TRINITY_DN13102_c0_g1_i1.p1 TRINITY_DN13102_c0_g1~~TRINITY_DN13102_c0_g1_i1.p1  ORF type:complete len:439 (+),score=82.47 TRINITY_DN13102_c0_g1_i1:141-1319(+)